MIGGNKDFIEKNEKKKSPLKISCQTQVILETPRGGGQHPWLLGYALDIR